MVTASEAERLSEEGKRAFDSGRYESAADLFRAAVQQYADLNDPVNAAEQRNNLSVVLLKMSRPSEALEAALDTDQTFAAVGDVRREGMALNNQAVALESLQRLDEALARYERSAALLGDAGEGEMRSAVLKAAAALQLRRGKLAESGLRMIGALEAQERPSFFERVLKSLLRLVQR